MVRTVLALAVRVARTQPSELVAKPLQEEVRVAPAAFGECTLH